MLAAGIPDFDAYAELRGNLHAAARSSPGSMGKYHMHMAYSVLVGSGWVKTRVVDWWPVADNAGTMRGLRGVFGKGLRGKAAIDALRELWHRLARAGELQQREHLGSLGAHLCWFARSRKASRACEFTNRYQEVTTRWNQDLADLRAAGILVEGWHRDA